MRVKRGVTKHARHKKFLRMAKGYWGRSKSCYRIARERVEKGLQYAYRDRRKKPGIMRRLWIQRINASARELGITYSRLMNGLNKIGFEWNRKTLSECAIHSPKVFESIVNKAQNAISAS